MLRFRVFFVALFSVSICITAQSAFAYKKEYHFYLTQILGSWCGLDSVDGYSATPFSWSTSRKIAWAALSVDRFPETDPGASFLGARDISKVENRAVFHFPMTERSSSVLAGSFEAKRLAIDVAQAARPNEDDAGLILFGIGLHRFQDSWAHAGFEPSLGHLFSGPTPDFPATAPGQALEMNREVWLLLDLFSKRTRNLPCDKDWGQIEPILRNWNSEAISTATDLRDRWRAHSLAVTGIDVELSGLLPPNRLEKVFVEQSEIARKLLLP